MCLLPEETIVEVTFVLTPEDLWTFNQFVIRRTTSFKLRMAVGFAFVPLCLIVFSSLAGFATWQCFLFGAVTAVVWVPFYLWSFRWQSARTARKRRAVLEKQTVSISAKGMRQVNIQSDALIWWTAILEVSESTTQIMFFSDKHYAFLVPKRAFTSLAEAEAFLEKARRYRDAVLNGQTLPEEAPAEDTGVWPPPPRPAAH